MTNEDNLKNLALRPNITEKENAWNLVPGDIVEHWMPHYLSVGSREATQLQREERMYYAPCVFCGRHIGRIKVEGAVETCARNNCEESNRPRKVPE